MIYALAAALAFLAYVVLRSVRRSRRDRAAKLRDGEYQKGIWP